MNSKSFIPALFVALTSVCCTSKAPDAPKPASDSVVVSNTQNVEASVPKKDLVINWNKPLYSLDEKGDTIERWMYNEKGLRVKYIRYNDVNDIFEYSYDGCKVTETMIFATQKITNVSEYSDETYTKLIGYNGKKFDLSADGKVMVSYKDGRTWRHTYDNQGRILKIVADRMPDTEDEALEYTYMDNGHVIEADFFGFVERDNLGRNVKSEGDCSETVWTYEGNCGISATKPVGECSGVDADGNIDGKPAPVTKTYTYYAQE